jgi:hypothetical protein
MTSPIVALPSVSPLGAGLDFAGGAASGFRATRPGASAGRCEPTLHRQTGHSSRRALGPGSGDKRVWDERPDACFHGRILHRPHARFATSIPTKGAAAALVLSPRTGRHAALAGADPG